MRIKVLITAKAKNAEISLSSIFDLDGGWPKFATMPSSGEAAGSVADKATVRPLIRLKLMPVPNLDIFLFCCNE